ncbi:MAG: 30S ribosomal protein S8 [Alphaproteobacteria bacterium]|nr:30S ribosomal protein S8 [Alphaproteobacteria bacterium]
MSISDPIADMLTRIRNAQKVKKAEVLSPASKERINVLEVLKREGYIRGYSSYEIRPNIKEIKIELKYRDDEPVIHEVKRISKPGRRVYASIKDLPYVWNGLGISIVSTSKGVMSDSEARKANIGGEILCNVF